MPIYEHNETAWTACYTREIHWAMGISLYIKIIKFKHWLVPAFG